MNAPCSDDELKRIADSYTAAGFAIDVHKLRNHLTMFRPVPMAELVRRQRDDGLRRLRTVNARTKRGR